jgi:hypothetical protein
MRNYLGRIIQHIFFRFPPQRCSFQSRGRGGGIAGAGNGSELGVTRVCMEMGRGRWWSMRGSWQPWEAQLRGPRRWGNGAVCRTWAACTRHARATARRFDEEGEATAVWTTNAYGRRSIKSVCWFFPANITGIVYYPLWRQWLSTMLYEGYMCMVFSLKMQKCSCLNLV